MQPNPVLVELQPAPPPPKPVKPVRKPAPKKKATAAKTCRAEARRRALAAPAAPRRATAGCLALAGPAAATALIIAENLQAFVAVLAGR